MEKTKDKLVTLEDLKLAFDYNKNNIATLDQQLTSLYNNLGFIDEVDPAITHRNIYRGKNLGTKFTDEQLKHIQDGTFEDLYVGDYWDDTSQGIQWMIADINYWGATNTAGTTLPPSVGNHLIIVPKDILYSIRYGEAKSVNNGYAGSELFSTGLDRAKNMIFSFFGESNIKPRGEFVSNAVTFTSGNITTISFSGLSNLIGLMSLYQIYGMNMNLIPFTVMSPIQLACFRLNESDIYHKNMNNRVYWTSDPGNQNGYYAIDVAWKGFRIYPSENSAGIRPIFAIG